MDKKKSQSKDFFEFLWNLYKSVLMGRHLHYCIAMNVKIPAVIFVHCIYNNVQVS